MAINFVRDGDVEQYTNGGSAISSGDVVAIGARLGVALVDLASGETGSVRMRGVFTVPKVSGAVVGVGESLTWDSSAGKFDDNLAVAAAGDVTGAASAAAAGGGSGENSLEVYFTGVPGTVA